MVYATWSTGYKGPALKTHLQPQTGTANGLEEPYVRPETVTDLELGIKAKALDNRLRVNVAGFIEQFHNFQVQAFNSAGLSTETNANGVKSAGVEINSSFRPIPALTFNYNATLLDSHFTSFPNNPCYTGQGCVQFEGAGLKTPSSARYTGTFETVATLPIKGAKLEISGNWYHRSSVNFSANGSPAQALGAIDVFGANIAYRGENGINLSVFCKNCFNRLYPNYIGADPLDGSGGVLSTFQAWGYNSVRTVGVLAKYSF
jgi:iron complex outermembrane receptor protein